MLESSDLLPDCVHSQPYPSLIAPITPTPRHPIYLSNLDDQNFLRFQVRYVYLFRHSIGANVLRESLSRILVPYYPLAGRLKRCSPDNDRKLQIDCNGEGAVFVEAVMDFTADRFLELAGKPSRSLRKLMWSVDAKSFLDIPPLVIQVTNLRCGGMILCTAINHCFCDGIGTSQFLHAWAQLTRQSHSAGALLPPYHYRHVFNPHNPQHVSFSYPGFSNIARQSQTLHHFLQSQPLIPASVTFSTVQILTLKRHSGKCTTFEILASYTWQCWVKSLGLTPSTTVKLLFSVNVRKLFDELPEGFYGNGFVLACAEAQVSALGVQEDVVKLVQQAKARVTKEYVRSMIDLMEDPTVGVDLSTSLVISQWSRLGLHELDFGQGKAVHMGPLSSYIYCVFLPVIGESDAVRVLLSMPESMVDKFEYYMKELCGASENGNNKEYGYVENMKMVSV